MKKINIIDPVGIDADLETSLFEYGLVIGKNDQCEEDEYFCLIGISGDNQGYDSFDFAYMRECDMLEDWADLEDIAGESGLSIEEWAGLPFVHKFSDLLSHYSPLNWAGTYTRYTVGVRDNELYWEASK